MNKTNMIRKNVCFPNRLLSEAREMSDKLDTNFSSFVRKAMEEYIEKVKIELLKEELIAQSKDTATLNKEICEDFKYVDGENI
jgi:metal-responsive CopG/Arc/MetJ family transcriptional regulator